MEFVYFFASNRMSKTKAWQKYTRDLQQINVVPLISLLRIAVLSYSSAQRHHVCIHRTSPFISTLNTLLHLKISLPSKFMRICSDLHYLVAVKMGEHIDVYRFVRYALSIYICYNFFLTFSDISLLCEVYLFWWKCLQANNKITKMRSVTKKRIIYIFFNGSEYVFISPLYKGINGLCIRKFAESFFFFVEIYKYRT